MQFLEVQAQHAFIRDEHSKGRWDAALTRSCFAFMMEVFERTITRDLGPPGAGQATDAALYEEFMKAETARIQGEQPDLPAHDRYGFSRVSGFSRLTLAPDRFKLALKAWETSERNPKNSSGDMAC